MVVSYCKDEGLGGRKVGLRAVVRVRGGIMGKG